MTPTPAEFAKVDANGDGKLDFAEVMAAKADDFRAADSDGSGCVPVVELERFDRGGAAMTMACRCGFALGAALLLLGGCQQPGGGEGAGFNYDQGPDQDQSGQISPLVGTLGGAGAGALLGRVLAGGHDNTAAILGGALLGGLAGNLGTNAFNEHKEQQATTQYDQQQQLAYTQSQLAQQEARQSPARGAEPLRRMGSAARPCRARPAPAR